MNESAKILYEQFAYDIFNGEKLYLNEFSNSQDGETETVETGANILLFQKINDLVLLVRVKIIQGNFALIAKGEVSGITFEYNGNISREKFKELKEDELKEIFEKLIGEIYSQDWFLKLVYNSSRLELRSFMVQDKFKKLEIERYPLENKLDIGIQKKEIFLEENQTNLEKPKEDSEKPHEPHKDQSRNFRVGAGIKESGLGWGIDIEKLNSGIEDFRMCKELTRDMLMFLSIYAGERISENEHQIIKDLLNGNKPNKKEKKGWKKFIPFLN